MNGRKPFTTIAAAGFAVIAILHVWRIVEGTEITIGGSVVPMAASWIAFAVTALLAVMLFRESAR
jgi:lipopolysaccharide export LptBFGC system permease protein LptF